MHQKDLQTPLPFLNYDYESKYIKFRKKEDKILIKGSRGHNTIYLKKSLSSKNYYFQVVGYQPQFYTQFLQYPSAFRVGVSPFCHSYNLPVGQSNSVAFKSNGQLVTKQTTQQFGESFKEGDIIGVGISVQQFKSQENEQKKNKVKFYKNGKLVGKPYELSPSKQWFFAISLYNEAEADIRVSMKDIKFLPEGFIPYSQDQYE